MFSLLLKELIFELYSPILGSPGRTGAEDESDLLKSGSSGIRKAKLKILCSQGREEVRKRDFRSLEVPAEMKCGSRLTHMWKSWQNKCGRLTRSSKSWPSEIWKAEHQIFGIKDRGELRKRGFRPLKVLAEWKCGR